MPAPPSDLISTAKFAELLGCTQRNVNDKAKRYGLKRYAGNRISRSQYERAEAAIGSAVQKENRAQANAPRSSGQSFTSDTRLRAEAARAAIRAEKERLELEKLKKSLVSADEVRAATFERARVEREALLNWPSQVTPDMAAKLGIDERLLHSELDAAVRKYLEERGTVK